MTQASRPVGRWMAALAAALVLSACGGGGGSAEAVRTGDYTLLAADAREYTLALDMEANTYRVAGNGVDQGGSIVAAGGEFLFQPGNATGATGSSTTRFRFADNRTVVGEFALPAGTVPFVAARVFETTFAGAVGTYNFLGRTVDTAGGAADTTIQQAEITADGQLRTCEDSGIFTIATCPASSVTTGTVTVAAGLFTAQMPGGNVPFRVAAIAGDKVFLRASASSGTTRRFVIGTPATASFAAATFAGGTTEPAWGTVTIGSGSFASTGTSPDGVTTTQTGSATPLARSDSRASLLSVSTEAAGNFFAARSAQIGVLVAARGSTTAPGFMAIGTRQ